MKKESKKEKKRLRKNLIELNARKDNLEAINKDIFVDESRLVNLYRGTEETFGDFFPKTWEIHALGEPILLTEPQKLLTNSTFGFQNQIVL